MRSLEWLAQEAWRRHSHSSAVIDRNRLGRCKAVEGFKALLAAVARTLDATERQLDSAAGAVIVDEDLPRVDGARQAELPGAVAGPDSTDKAKGRPVRQIDRLLLAVEGHDDLDRPEDLLLHEAVARRNVANQRRRDIGAAGGRVGHDRALRGKTRAVTSGQADIAFDDVLLPAGNHGADV